MPLSSRLRILESTSVNLGATTILGEGSCGQRGVRDHGSSRSPENGLEGSVSHSPGKREEMEKRPCVEGDHLN